MTLVHYAHVTPEAKLVLDAPVAFKQGLHQFAGKPVELVVRKPRKSRSDDQLKWYWGQILHLLSEETGHEPEELHEYCKTRFIPKRLAICDGNGVVLDERVIGGSTTKLSTVEMADYCEAIRRWAAMELGVVIPDPDPAWRQRAQRRRSA